MAHCTNCGKFMLWGDENGRCKKCAKAQVDTLVRPIDDKQMEAQPNNETVDNSNVEIPQNIVDACADDERNMANGTHSTIYRDLAQAIASLPSIYTVSANSIEEIDAAIQLFDNAADLWSNDYCKRKSFIKEVKESSEKEGISFGYNKDLRVHIYDREDPADVAEREIKYIRDAKSRYMLARKSTEKFLDLVQSIERVDVGQNESATFGTRNVDEFPEFNSRNITKNTSAGKVSDYIVIDVETTGLSYRKDEIVQLCAIRYENHIPVNCFITYIKPHKGLHKKAQEINKITEADIQDAPYFEQIVDAFDAYIGTKLPIVGHNVSFDCKFLYAAGSNAISAKRVYYDTVMLAKRIYKDLSSYSLSSIMDNRYIASSVCAHNALFDAAFCGKVFSDACSEIIAI